MEHKNKMEEKLTAQDDAGEWVKDFRKSDAPQFKGKSDMKKQKMAIAAYLSKRDSKNESASEKTTGRVDEVLGSVMDTSSSIARRSYTRGMKSASPERKEREKKAVDTLKRYRVALAKKRTQKEAVDLDEANYAPGMFDLSKNNTRKLQTTYNKMKDSKMSDKDKAVFAALKKELEDRGALKEAVDLDEANYAPGMFDLSKNNTRKLQTTYNKMKDSKMSDKDKAVFAALKKELEDRGALKESVELDEAKYNYLVYSKDGELYGAAETLGKAKSMNLGSGGKIKTLKNPMSQKAFDKMVDKTTQESVELGEETVLSWMDYDTFMKHGDVVGRGNSTWQNELMRRYRNGDYQTESVVHQEELEYINTPLYELTDKQRAEIASRKAMRQKQQDKKTAAKQTKTPAPVKKTGSGITPDQKYTSKGKGTGKSKKGVEHIIMQMRRAQDLDKTHHDLQVSPTRTVKVHKSIIDKALSKHDSMQKPTDKRKFRVDLVRALRKQGK